MLYLCESHLAAEPLKSGQTTCSVLGGFLFVFLREEIVLFTVVSLVPRTILSIDTQKGLFL